MKRKREEINFLDSNAVENSMRIIFNDSNKTFGFNYSHLTNRFELIKEKEISGKSKLDLILDFDKIFGGFISVIKSSTYGSVFKLFGGEKALEPLRKPFKIEFERQASEILVNIDIASVLQKETDFETFKTKISAMVETTLNELTPQRVKEIVEEMIRMHLGWLVVWGGVFGALIGFVSAVFF